MGLTKEGATRVSDLSDLHRYSTKIPDIAFELPLSAYGFRLYVHMLCIDQEGSKKSESIRENEGGQETVAICANCHREYHALMSPRSELTAKGADTK